MSPVCVAEPRYRAAEISGEQLDFGGRLCGDMSALDDFTRELGERTNGVQTTGDAGDFLPRRINADPATVEKDLAKLVLSLIDVVRQLMERQAIRRVNAGSLSEDQVERMGETFLRLDRKMTELRLAFGLRNEDLNLNLGPIHD